MPSDQNQTTAGWLRIADNPPPTSGANFLACSVASSVFLAHWANGLVDSSSYQDDHGYLVRHATHWQPLPDPPAS
jgi:Protein of unknown function (DUF551)